MQLDVRNVIFSVPGHVSPEGGAVVKKPLWLFEATYWYRLEGRNLVMVKVYVKSVSSESQYTWPALFQESSTWGTNSLRTPLYDTYRGNWAVSGSRTRILALVSDTKPTLANDRS